MSIASKPRIETTFHEMKEQFNSKKTRNRNFWSFSMPLVHACIHFLRSRCIITIYSPLNLMVLKQHNVSKQIEYPCITIEGFVMKLTCISPRYCPRNQPSVFRIFIISKHVSTYFTVCIQRKIAANFFLKFRSLVQWRVPNDMLHSFVLFKRMRFLSF